MSSKDDLRFHDSGDGEDVMFERPGGQTHTFTNFPDSAVDIDDEEDTGDKAGLLKDGEKKSASFWTFEYYQQFFDVETRDVFGRVLGSMTPLPSKRYLDQNIRPNPDLYGPFWICTTLVFTTAIAGNLANYLSQAGDYHWRYDFHKVTFAATAIFSYWWLIPAVLYGILWWRKSQSGFTFLEMLCVYGYSLAIYIPISILWVVNIMWFKWVLVVVGAVLSGGVLVLTFWPAMKHDTPRIAAIFTAVIFLLHLALAAGFVLYFFHVPSTSVVTPSNTTTVATTLKPAMPENLKHTEKPKLPESPPDKQEKTETPGDASKIPTEKGNGVASVEKPVKATPGDKPSSDKASETAQHARREVTGIGLGEETGNQVGTN